MKDNQLIQLMVFYENKLKQIEAVKLTDSLYSIDLIKEVIILKRLAYLYPLITEHSDLINPRRGNNLNPGKRSK